ncbi:PEPxxWA-CTERM sorting domain-containing protein [Parasphingorhabdus sp.]|uniref:PEPxxWA-CTERM sorting domain-containing protein n=1 Tax=Parasphingorhabdus sp. TaxID=2709688 RepID=UPI00329A075E
MVVCDRPSAFGTHGVKMKKIILATAAAMLLSSTANATVLFYQEGFSNNLYSYDTDTATETLVGDLGLGADSTGLSFGLNGALYAFERASQSLYTINTATAAATLVGNAGIGAEDFTISLDGTQGFATASGSLYSIDLATGGSTLIGATSPTLDGLTTALTDVTINGSMFAAGSIFGVDSGDIFSVDVLTGASSLLGSSSGVNEALAFGSDGFLYGYTGGGLNTIDLDTFASTQIFDGTPGNVFGLAAQTNRSVGAVPEPATWAFMIFGFGAIGGAMRRQRKANVKVSYA